MSKEPAQNSRLLSKVVKFVTNPTTNWADLDRIEERNREHDQDQDIDLASRQALKKIIERKRNNDFVRNREFDMLRKMLRSQQAEKSPESMQGMPPPPASERGRVNHDAPHQPVPSAPAPAHARADTLKKIDQIERQMARAWFKKKGGKDAGDTTPSAPMDYVPSDRMTPEPAAPERMAPEPPRRDPAAAPREFAPPAERPASQFWSHGAVGGMVPPPAAPAVDPAAIPDFPPIPVPASVLERAPVLQTPILQAPILPEPEPEPVLQAPLLPEEPEPALVPMLPPEPQPEPDEPLFRPERGEAVARPAFEPTRVLEEAPRPPDAPAPQAAAPAPAFAHDAARQPPPEPEPALTAETLDPELEEAAIRFANGDIQGAEASLLALLGNDGARNNHVETWLTLFDLYRASGQQAKFDEAAIDFASCFGRSAPQWSANVDVMPAAPAAADGKPLAPGMTARMHWVCPASLGAQSVAALNASLGRNASPWRIDWQNLKTIEDAALPPLLDTLKRWGGSKGEYHMRGADRLLAVLVECSPTDIREVDPQWWSARLALLRLMNEMDEFELVALNYCVTYEVSPPSWEDPVARFVPVAAPAPGGAAPAQPQEAAEKQDAPHDADDAHDQAFQPTDFLASHVFETEEGVIKGDLEGVITDDVDKVLQPVNISINRAVHARVVDINCRLLMRMDFGAAGALLNWVTMQQTLKRQVVLRQVNRLVGAFFGVIGIHEVARVVLRKD